MPRRPPGRSTRKLSAKTAGRSVDRLITQLEITTSTDASGNGTASIWPLRNVTFAAPACRAFARASAESHPGDQAEQAAEAYRHWVRALLTELSAQAGVPAPEMLARQLHLLYDGSGQSARMDHDPAAAAEARAAAAVLLDAALAHSTAAAGVS